MAQIPSHRRALPLALVLCVSLAAAGCALLIPPSWRGRAPIPLSGPIDPIEAADSAPAEEAVADRTLDRSPPCLDPEVQRRGDVLRRQRACRPELPSKSGPTGFAALSDERLLELVAADERRLVELASAQPDPALSPEAAAEAQADAARELREIADRLPLAQHELEVRGVGRSGARIRHPVIR
jgi:hypothetical protein